MVFQLLTYLTRDLNGFARYLEKNFDPEIWPEVHKCLDRCEKLRKEKGMNSAKHLAVLKLLGHLRAKHHDARILVFSHSV
jgi:hypothetical protein